MIFLIYYGRGGADYRNIMLSMHASMHELMIICDCANHHVQWWLWVSWKRVHLVFPSIASHGGEWLCELLRLCPVIQLRLLVLQGRVGRAGWREAMPTETAHCLLPRAATDLFYGKRDSGLSRYNCCNTIMAVLFSIAWSYFSSSSSSSNLVGTN